MNNSKTVSPTGSYKIDIPSDVVENIDDRVTSYWRQNENVLLQLSSYLRVKGDQLNARQRLNERLLRDSLKDVNDENIGPVNCPDVATASGLDAEGITWFYCYAVWPDLTVFITISGTADELQKSGRWAFNALKSLRR